jgi:flavin reductase (DIM6/NTAB) family NADH-FMN oxidoreductase RutF
MADKWDGLSQIRGETGVPILSNVLVTLECESYRRYDGGDHEIFVGRVIEIREGRAKQVRPLVFFEGPYYQLDRASASQPPLEETVLLHGW